MAETIHLTVRRVRFRDDGSGYTVAIGTPEAADGELTFVGHFTEVPIGEPVAITGEWRNDKKYGRQFAAESLAPLLPTGVEEIKEYLASGHVSGIGPALAERLAERFGTDTFRILDEEPERLREIFGVGKRTLQKIKNSWRQQRRVRDVMVFLVSCGLGGARAFRVHQRYGVHTIATIRENPYCLAHGIRGIGFTTADAIARRLGHDERSEFRVLAGLCHVVEEERDLRGHCGLPADDALTKTVQLLGVEPALVADAIETAVAHRVLEEEPLGGRRYLFEPYLYRAESRIAVALAALAAEAPEWDELDADVAIRTAEEDSGITLDATQRRAIELAFQSKAMVITGGPGVGKTTLVRALVAVYERAGMGVLLAAPTGRAAKRLGEMTGREAQTIHRLLETSPEDGRFQRNEGNPLETDVVIVDESSMVDVPLLDAVLRALPPGAAIVLVGDADQLPSIGPGQVLHDILASQRIPSVRLTEIHRQAEGSQIVANAHRINRGEPPKFGKDVADMFLFRARSPADAVRHVVDLVKSKIPEKFKLRSLRDVQVLAPMRGRAIGVDVLNAELQNVLNPPAGHKARVDRPKGVFFCPRDKVMQTENNYEKGVFNGDVGVIATVNMAKEKFTVDFGGDLIVDYAFAEADQLTLAYATTIHKSQGSEYEAVVVALMPEHGIMLRRNLLYTAVTRGRKLVVVVGDEASVEKAVRTGRGGERCTRLAHCLSTSSTRGR